MRGSSSMAAILGLARLIASQGSVPVIDRTTRSINAPLNCNNDYSYMGYHSFDISPATPFSADRCADWCNGTSLFNLAHPPQDPREPPKLCRFYNTYILRNNTVPKEQVCAMYTQYWDPLIYAVNDGYYDGQGNHLTISSSVFSTNTTAGVNPICPADIAELQEDRVAGAFCTSVISFTASPAATLTTTRTETVEACRATATPTTAARIRRDDGNDSGVKGVAAFYPEKFNAGATGDPVLIAIPAELLLSSGIYASATSLAIDILASDTPEATNSVTSVATSTSTSVSSKTKSQTTPLISLIKRQVASVISEAVSPILEAIVPTPESSVPVVVVTATRVLTVTPVPVVVVTATSVASTPSVVASTLSVVASAPASSSSSSVASAPSSSSSAAPSLSVASTLSVVTSTPLVVGTPSAVSPSLQIVGSTSSAVVPSLGVVSTPLVVFVPSSIVAPLVPVSVFSSSSVASSRPSAASSTSSAASSTSSAASSTSSAASTTSQAPIPTPSVFAGREARELASVCSRIVNATATSTEEAVATFTDYANCNLNPSTCTDGSAPAQLIAGSFNSSTDDIDDSYYQVDLDFDICIYDECSSRVFPSTNGLVSLGTQNVGINDYVNRPLPAENGMGVLSAFWDDLYIHKGQPHYMDYSVCGPNGTRTVTFDWRMGRYDAPGDGPLYSWSATFYEDRPSRVFLKYFNTTDQGASATVGIEGKANNIEEFFQYSYQSPKITDGLALVFDPRKPYFGQAELEPNV